MSPEFERETGEFIEATQVDEAEVTRQGIIRKVTTRLLSVTNFSLNTPREILSPEELQRRDHALAGLTRETAPSDVVI